MKGLIAYFKSEILRYCLIGLVLILMLPNVVLSEAFTPNSGNFVVLKLTATVKSPNHIRLQQLQKAYRKQPDEANALILTKHLLYLASQTSDPRFYDMAKTLIESKSRHFNQPEWLFHHAKVLQFHHQFAAALQRLDQLLSINKHYLEARMMKISLLMTTGEINQINSECQFLYQYHQYRHAEICVTIAKAYSLPSTSAHQLLQHYATDIVQAKSLSSSMRGWALSVFAEIASYHEQYSTAESFYRMAINVNPQANYIKINLLDTLLIQKKFNEAEHWLDPESMETPQLIRLIYIQKKLHQTINQHQLDRLDSIFKLADAREDRRHLREQALYAWWIEEDLERALNLAQANWVTQREFIDNTMMYSIAMLLNNKSALQMMTDWRISQSLILNQEVL